jgi:transcriptional regulator with XRE-family HTH domain
MQQKQAQQIDKVIGRNIRIHRLAKNLSQTELAAQLGVSFQQVQKYENGTNRVGSGRLYNIASILGVHVSTFFHGGEDREPHDSSTLLDLLTEPQSLRLARAFSKITDPSVRLSLVKLAEKFAGPPSMGTAEGSSPPRKM